VRLDIPNQLFEHRHVMRLGLFKGPLNLNQRSAGLCIRAAKCRAKVVSVPAKAYLTALYIRPAAALIYGRRDALLAPPYPLCKSLNE
jgi:hypothetical protein